MTTAHSKIDDDKWPYEVKLPTYKITFWWSQTSVGHERSPPWWLLYTGLVQVRSVHMWKGVTRILHLSSISPLASISISLQSHPFCGIFTTRLVPLSIQCASKRRTGWTTQTQIPLKIIGRSSCAQTNINKRLLPWTCNIQSKVAFPSLWQWLQPFNLHRSWYVAYRIVWIYSLLSCHDLKKCSS